MLIIVLKMIQKEHLVGVPRKMHNDLKIHAWGILLAKASLGNNQIQYFIIKHTNLFSL